MKISWSALLLAGFCALAQARVSHIVIDRVESPTFEGREFGRVGRYEKLSGRAHGEIDPSDPLNAGITYIKDAPRNSRGRVEYVVDVHIIRPVDMAKGNGTLLYDVVNRGARRAFEVFNLGESGGNDPSSAADAGDGFLLRQGYTLVVSGWQGDVPRSSDNIVADIPVATRGGRPITKTITAEFIVTKPVFTLPLGWDNGAVLRPHPPVESAMASARLIRRAHAHAPDELIPRGEWSFGQCPDGKTVTPSNADVCLPAGFSTDAVYYLVYQARDPLVMGLAFASIRDVVSFLRYSETEANPLVAHSGRAPQPNAIQRAIGFGRSQSGRVMKDLVHLGFNQDEAKHIVFDGVISMTGGARLTNVNAEFSMPGRFSTPLVGHYSDGDQFPFTYEVIRDPVSGRSDGVLARCRAQKACPKIMHWDSGTEPWTARNSLVITDTLGKSDVTVPDNVRLYYFAGTQHVPAAQPRTLPICQNPSNTNPYKEGMRALLLEMQEWIRSGRTPPPSRFPSLADKTLVRPLPQEEYGFPAIPERRYAGEANDLYVNDYGVQPPRHPAGKQYPVFVPKIDADGNELPGVRSVALQVPLGTHTGWNLRRKEFMEDRSCYLEGSLIPFAATKAERGADPRPSLVERYGSKANYVKQVEAAARQLLREGFLLSGDAERLVLEARARSLGF